MKGKHANHATGFFFFRLTLTTLTASGAAIVASSAGCCGGGGGDGVGVGLWAALSSSPSTTYSSNLPVEAFVDCAVALLAADKSTSIACFCFFGFDVDDCPFVCAPSGTSSVRTTSAGGFDLAGSGGASSSSSLTMGMLSTSTSPLPPSR